MKRPDHRDFTDPNQSRDVDVREGYFDTLPPVDEGQYARLATLLDCINDPVAMQNAVAKLLSDGARLSERSEEALELLQLSCPSTDGTADNSFIKDWYKRRDAFLTAGEGKEG